MAQSTALIETLKQALKAHQLTYARVADKIGMSEANVKRMFAARRFSLDRLEQICQLMGMELSDLVALYDESRQRITQLSYEQEQELVQDVRLLLVAVSVRSRLDFDHIVTNYQISKTECIAYLAKLDKLKIIDLLPNNRIKLRIDENFSWLPNGPIERFFEKQVQAQFLKSSFNHEFSQRLFQFGLLTDPSIRILMNKMQGLAREFGDLHRQDSQQPLEKRSSIGFILALRPWELQAFESLHRQAE